MLFNSIPFLFGFLPVVLAVYFALGRRHQLGAVVWLVLAALFFYGYWNPAYIPLLLASILVNYAFGLSIASTQSRGKPLAAKALLVASLAFDLGLLGYFKYSNFFLDVVGDLFESHLGLGQIVLPLGISFYTFTQIAFLVDVYQRKAREPSLAYYAAFVTYFPHLIAGPILHHAEMMPQFRDPKSYRLDPDSISIGSLIFATGLFKKVFLADKLAPYADAVFAAAQSGTHVGMLESWIGVLAYTFQIYFDFSGYSDMAIGLAKMINVRLPINFNSPYKAGSVIDFWRRWHITLSRFLRDYLYIPLGGNRHGELARYRNLMLTMLLGGLWHGAGWPFLVWGGLHGTYLALNHAWRAALERLGVEHVRRRLAYRSTAFAATFVSVAFAWVFFRADSLRSAQRVLAAMVSVDWAALRERGSALVEGSSPAAVVAAVFHPANLSALPDGDFRFLLPIACLLVWAWPNTQQFFYDFAPALETYPGDLRPLPGGLAIDWPRFWPARMVLYIWPSYALIALFSVCFYTHDADTWVYRHLPWPRELIGIDSKRGDFRSNLFINGAFASAANRIVIVGSSYTQQMGAFTFHAEGKDYYSGTAGMEGNYLNNGFRTALAIIDNFDVDTILFGIAPLGFERVLDTNAAFPKQCFGALESLGAMVRDRPLLECSPSRLSRSDLADLLVAPGKKSFVQLHGFLSKLSGSYVPLSGAETVEPFDMEKYDASLAHYADEVRLAEREPLPVLDPKNGADTVFHWESRGVLDSLGPEGAMYEAFSGLKRICDRKGVRLVVYETPTVSHAEAPAIYPEGFFEEYGETIRRVMAELEIPYIDLSQVAPWDDRFFMDFIHLQNWARHMVHQELLYQLFFRTS